MTIKYLKPALPEYLITAMKQVDEALRERGEIRQAIENVSERLSAITDEMLLLEDTLGDLEAESLLKRKPDTVKVIKTQDKLHALQAEQRKLQAAEKSLRQKDEDHEQAILEADADLSAAKREFGIEMIDVLDAELQLLCLPVQDVMHVARVIHSLWNESALRNRFDDANLRTYKESTPLLGESAYSGYRKPSPSEASKLAAEWDAALAPARDAVNRIHSPAQYIKESHRRQQEEAQQQREREERLKPRYIYC